MKLIFTDLDGTLLDHHTYSFQEAKESLDYLKQNNIPIIINTSKTKAEVIDLRKELGVEDSPFIVENGGGVFFPKHFKFDNLKMIDNYYLLKIGKSYSEILEFFDSVKGRYSIKGFHQMSVEDVMKHTGLSYKESEKAKKRDFSEPFIFEDESVIGDLRYEASEYSISITKGGRFYHLISQNQDKGIALLKTKEIYENRFGKKFETIGLGDGKNDFPMLNKSDYPVLIQTSKGDYENSEIRNHIKSAYCEPKGWNSSIKEIFNV